MRPATTGWRSGHGAASIDAQVKEIAIELKPLVAQRRPGAGSERDGDLDGFGNR